MALFDFFRAKPEEATITKADDEITTSRQLASLLLNLDGDSLNGTYDYNKNVHEAYMRNPVAFYCLNLIADAACAPRWELYLNETEIEKEPAKGNPLRGVYNFIQRPNELQSLNEFIREFLIHFYLAGEAFITVLPDAKAFARGNGKLMLIDPSKVQIDGKFYVINGTQRIPMENPDGTRDILHLREWSPDSKRGMSRLQPAWLSVSNMNQAQRWNHSVLKNSGRLSLVAVMKSFGETKGSTLTSEQLADLNKDITKFATGAGRGKPFVATGDWDFKELGLNNKDLEWLKGMEAMARNIALAFGIDPVLLSLPGDSTYSNKEQALSSLFKNIALPRLNQLVEELEHWFKQMMPGEWEFRLNLDDVIALEPEREKRWDRAMKSGGVLTINERRELMGYEPIEGGDTLGAASTPEEEKPEEDKPSDDEKKPEEETDEDNEKDTN